MKHIAGRVVAGTSILAFAFLVMGCGAAPEAEDDVTVSTSQHEATVLECTADLTQCVGAARSISALVGCNGDYAECLTGSVEDTVGQLPGAVVDAVDGTIECTANLRSCVRAASSPSELVICEEAQVACVADVLDVPLPDVPLSGAVECAESATECVADARSLEDLTACTTDLAECTTDAVVDIVDEVPVIGGPLGDAIGQTEDCLSEALTCTTAAQSPAELIDCQQGQVECLAGVVGVELPNPFDAVDCADSAAQCVLEARSLSELQDCAEDLSVCGGGFIEDTVGGLPLPGELGDAVNDLTGCAVDLQSCVVSAESPDDLLACEDANVTCVGGTLGVDLPSGSDAIECVEAGTECVFEASSLAELDACRQELTTCAGDLVPTTGVPLVDCTAQFTQCLAVNPFALFDCAEEARICNETP